MPKGSRPRSRQQPPRFVAVWSAQGQRWEVLNSRSLDVVKLAADEREAKALARNLTRFYAAEPGPND